MVLGAVMLTLHIQAAQQIFRFVFFFKFEGADSVVIHNSLRNDGIARFVYHFPDQTIHILHTPTR